MKTNTKVFIGGMVLLIVLVAVVVGRSPLYKGSFGGFNFDPRNIRPLTTSRERVAVNRAELAQMLVTSLGFPLDYPGSATFVDVPRNHWAFPYVETAVANGIFQGYSDGTFRPSNIINRAEFAVVATRAFGLSDASLYPNGAPTFSDILGRTWYSDAVRILYATGAVEVEYRPNAPAERAFVQRALDLLSRSVRATPG